MAFGSRMQERTSDFLRKLYDEAVAVLIAMPSLREVDLKGTAVTEKGADMLRAAKPRAVVYIGPWEGKAAAYSNN